MENFLFTVNAVLPLFVIIAAGWLCRRKRLIVEDNIRFINRLCFRVLFPCIGFSSGYSSTLSFSDLRLIGFSLGAYAASFAILLLAVPHFVRSREQACVVIHAGFRSNIVLFGIGMAYNLFGEAGAGPSILTVATMVPLGNVMSVLLMKIYDRGEGEPVNAASVIRSGSDSSADHRAAARNPLLSLRRGSSHDYHRADPRSRRGRRPHRNARPGRAT